MAHVPQLGSPPLKGDSPGQSFEWRTTSKVIGGQESPPKGCPPKGPLIIKTHSHFKKVETNTKGFVLARESLMPVLAGAGAVPNHEGRLFPSERQQAGVLHDRDVVSYSSGTSAWFRQQPNKPGCLPVGCFLNIGLPTKTCLAAFRRPC